MSSAVFILSAVVWTGLLAGLAELLTARNMTPHAGQGIWRGAGALMALPWGMWLLVSLWPDIGLNLNRDLPWPALVGEMGALGEALPGISVQSAPASPTWPITELVLGSLSAGWLLRSCFAVVSHGRLARLTRHALVLENGPALVQLRLAANQAGLKHVPKLAFLETAQSPFVSGLRTKTLYVPRALLSSPSLHLIMLHECVHIARGDLVTRPLERAIADLIWFSPFAWLARVRLDHWRELVCDSETVRISGNRHAYARALTETARVCRPIGHLPVAALLFNPQRTLPMRISTLINTPSPRASRPRLLVGAISALIAAPIAIAQGLSTDMESEAAVFESAVITYADARITSSFGMRTHPITKQEIFHRGTDIAAPFGTLITTPGAARVVMTGKKDGYGTFVEVELHGSGHRLRFAQLQSFNVAVGDQLQAGDTIGEVGASGRATGPHLHFEYLSDDGDTYVDAETIEGLTLISQN